MKALYFILIISLFISCRSVDKLIEKGNYDEAISLLVNKIAGKKNKKDEHLVSLENAFVKATKRDFNRIEFLKEKNESRDYDEIYAIYSKMQKRQFIIEPLLPLVGKNGYKPHFKLVNYNEDLIEYADKAFRYHYTEAKELLTHNSKVKARQAYLHLEQALYYNENVKDIDYLFEKALNKGSTFVSVEHNNNIRSFESWTLEEEMISWPFFKLDKKWLDFEYYSEEDVNIDYHVIIELNDIWISDNNQHTKSYSSSKQIQVQEEKWEVKESQDSTKTSVSENKTITVKANISETFRKKEAHLKSRIKFIDSRNDAVVYVHPIDIYEIFEGYSNSFDGDERAVDIILDSSCESFPSDEEMLMTMIEVFQVKVFDEIDKFDFNI